MMKVRPNEHTDAAIIADKECVCVQAGEGEETDVAQFGVGKLAEEGEKKLTNEDACC